VSSVIWQDFASCKKENNYIHLHLKDTASAMFNTNRMFCCIT
jgi:hypothetical protein